MSPRGRYAPSPTGPLHLGNARTALLAWWRARATDSSFVMRVEDLDEARSREEHVQGNLDELRWLGLDWDEGPDVGGPHGPYRQSERHDRYEAALTRLTEGSRVFACYLSRSDLREIASAPHGRAPIYGARERRANERVKAEKIAAGKEPALRFAVQPGVLSFDDLVHGAQTADAETDVGDVVVRRADRVWSYQLAVVVDDLAMEIDEVVRGADLLDVTATQVALCEALGGTAPAYVHVPLLHDLSGDRMAKRKGSLTLASLRASGVPAERVVGLLAASLGLLDVPEPVAAGDLIAAFDLARIGREPTRLTDRDLAFLGISESAA